MISYVALILLQRDLSTLECRESLMTNSVFYGQFSNFLSEFPNFCETQDVKSVTIIEMKKIYPAVI